MIQRQHRSGTLLLVVLLVAPSYTVASDVCISGQFDAITRIYDGRTFAFKGDFVIQLNYAGTDVAYGYPKPIFEVFPGLPTNLYAAVYWPNGKTYFFKGSQYWRTFGTTIDDGYPMRIAYGWPGLPDDIDAAVVWGRNGKGYFFKGTKYWRYLVDLDRTEEGNLDTNTHWPGYNQGTVDAAFQWSNGRTYFFKDELYWRYDDANDRVDSGYPLWTTKHWLGCPTNGPTVPMWNKCFSNACL
ncbi:uncharacterized protein [Apostichopus japonicus]|uniref:uncharacterized protein n=1 Tax=Stichopus japonicus TaxID=307972 RepID=UPI003AB5ADE1